MADTTPRRLFWGSLEHRAALRQMATRGGRVRRSPAAVAWRIAAALADPFAAFYSDGSAACQVHDVRRPWVQAGALVAGYVAGVGLFVVSPAASVAVLLVVLAASGRIHALLAASRFRTRISWYASNLTRYPGAPKGAGLRLARAVYGSLQGPTGSRATNDALLAYYLSHDTDRRLDGPLRGRRMIFESATPTPDRTDDTATSAD